MIHTYHTRLTDKKLLAPEVYLLRFELTESKEIEFIPGQYVILRLTTPEGLPASRLFSIASSNALKSSFELLIKLEPFGLASTYFDKLQVGEEATFQGPAGMFRLKENKHNKIFLITGTGYAPVRSMLFNELRMTSDELRIHMFWGLPTFKDIYLFDELKKWRNENDNFQFKICISRETDLSPIADADKHYFSLGRITKAFDEMLQVKGSMLHDTDFYLCGNREVVESLRTYLAEKNIPRENIIFEKF